MNYKDDNEPYEDRLTESDKKALDNVIDDQQRLEKLTTLSNEFIRISDNDDLLIFIESLIDQLSTIDYNDHKQITNKLDDLFWQDNYYDSWSTDYNEKDEEKIKQLFGGGKDTTPKERNGMTFVNGVWYSGGFHSRNRITTNSKVLTIPDYITLKSESFTTKVKFSLSSIATAKLFIMMKFYQNVEWGAYLRLNKALPKLDDLFKEGEEIEIIAEDLILIPQIRSSGHVEYLENELPEFMEEWRKAKLEGHYVNSGRIHSHHTIGAYHSQTDTGEFEEAFKTEDRMFSIVSAFSDKVNKIPYEIPLDDFDKFFDGLEFDSILFIPLINEQKQQVNAKYGYMIRESLWLARPTFEDIEKAVEWREGFEKMDVFVNLKYPVIEKILELQDLGKVNDIDFYHTRKLLFENTEMFSFVEDLVNSIYEESKNAIEVKKLEAKLNVINELTKPKK